MQSQSTASLPIVNDKRVTLRRDTRGWYVLTFTYKWYASAPVNARVGDRVLVRFDVPGSKTVSVWRGDRCLGDFTRD